MDIEITSASIKDTAEVIALWQACGLVVSHNDPEVDFAFALSGDNSTVLIARDDEGVIRASTMVGHDGHRGWLYYVAADPGLRGSGLGARIVAAAEAWLVERGVWKAQLLVRETNRGVMSFYEKLGYEEWPRVVMSKLLK